MKYLSVLLAVVIPISFSGCDSRTTIEEENLSTEEIILNPGINYMDKYSYERAGDFASYINENLNNVNGQIELFEGLSGTAAYKTEVKRDLRRLKQISEKLEGDLSEINRIPRSNWKSYREQVNSDLSLLQAGLSEIQEKMVANEKELLNVALEVENIESISHRQQARLKNEVSENISMVEEKLAVLESRLSASSGELKNEFSDELTKLKTEKEAVKQEISVIDTIPEENWDEFKDTVRENLEDVEKTFNQVAKELNGRLSAQSSATQEEAGYTLFKVTTPKII